MKKTIMIIVTCFMIWGGFSPKVSAALVKVPEPIAHYTFEDIENPYADQSGNGMICMRRGLLHLKSLMESRNSMEKMLYTPN